MSILQFRRFFDDFYKKTQKIEKLHLIWAKFIARVIVTGHDFRKNSQEKYTYNSKYTKTKYNALPHTLKDHAFILALTGSLSCCTGSRNS